MWGPEVQLWVPLGATHLRYISSPPDFLTFIILLSPSGHSERKSGGPKTEIMHASCCTPRGAADEGESSLRGLCLDFLSRENWFGILDWWTHPIELQSKQEVTVRVKLADFNEFHICIIFHSTWADICINTESLGLLLSDLAQTNRVGSCH